MPRRRKEAAFARELPAHVQRIRSLREDHDLTQSQVAKILNVSQRTYSDYELGTIRIPVESLIQLAQFYNKDMNYITGLTRSAHSFPSGYIKSQER